MAGRDAGLARQLPGPGEVAPGIQVTFGAPCAEPVSAIATAATARTSVMNRGRIGG